MRFIFRWRLSKCTRFLFIETKVNQFQMEMKNEWNVTRMREIVMQPNAIFAETKEAEFHQWRQLSIQCAMEMKKIEFLTRLRRQLH